MREALRYRFLFEQMVRRELRQKYKGSALGVAWYLVNPLVLMGAYYLMFGVVLSSPFEIDNYPLFILIGIALVVAVLHAYFRDVAPILAAALLPWFFVTPIFFRASNFPGSDAHPWLEPLLRWVNPVAPFIDAIRSVLYDGRGPGWATVGYV